MTGMMPLAWLDQLASPPVAHPANRRAELSNRCSLVLSELHSYPFRGTVAGSAIITSILS